VLTDRLRDRDDIARDLVGVAGLTALAIGLVILAPTKALGFNGDRAFQGVLDALPVTLPAALLMLVVTAVDSGEDDGERPSRLLGAAADAGAVVVDGIEVLVQQGALSFRIWTGREAPVEAMRAAARA